MSTDTSDRELLELAAKAAGFGNSEFDKLFQSMWNPLTNDGDEARLEAVLSLNVSWGPNRVQVGRDIQFAPAEYYADHSGDKRAARRLAGVRAAAEIGKRMMQETVKP